MELNNYKKGESADVEGYVGSFQEQDIDIKMETPYFEVYDGSFRDESIDEKIKLPEVEGFEGIIQDSNIEYKNIYPDVQECGINIQGEDNVKKEKSNTEELAGSIEEEYMDLQNERSDGVKMMTMHECCNGGLLELVEYFSTFSTVRFIWLNVLQ